MEDSATREAAAYLLETLTRSGDETKADSAGLTTQIFGGFIRSLRRERGMSRREVQSISDLGEPVLTAVELGYVPLDKLSNLLPPLARALSYNLSDMRELLDEAALDARQILARENAMANGDPSLPELIDNMQ
jgi:transcriptional regulator with XRE-family HTH domain